MFIFVSLIIILLMAIGGVITSFKIENDKVPVRIASGIAGFFSILVLVIMCINIVPANSVGIPVTFGNVGSDLQSGFHFTSPFTEITTLTTRVQELSMLSAVDEGDKSKDDSINVVCGSLDSNGRLSSGGSASVDVTVKFIIDRNSASKLYKTAGTMSVIKDTFVRSDTREIVRDVFGLHSCEEGYSTNRAALAIEITDELKARLIVRGIIIDSVNIRDVRPSEAVLTQINSIAATRAAAANAIEDQKKQITEAKTRVDLATQDAKATVTKAQGDADAKIITATAEAEANARVAASLTVEYIDYVRAQALAKANTIYVPSNSNILIGTPINK